MSEIKQKTAVEQAVLERAIMREFDSCFSDVEEFALHNPGKTPEEGFKEAINWLLSISTEEIIKTYGEDIGEGLVHGAEAS